ncbi:MAG: hypothetical protein QGF90_02110, partial [Gammaproteobacteria bacterium]|nr:hypothetical protein [Gammaproteobacteria bacterium]
MRQVSLFILCVFFAPLLLTACGAPEDSSVALQPTSATAGSDGSAEMLSTDDPFIWLEEAEGPEALAWAAQQ